MRDLSECKEEIFRRSESRIRQRRKRRISIAVSCIPVCLCLSLYSALILPSMMPANQSSPGEKIPEHQATMIPADSISYPAVGIVIPYESVTIQLASGQSGESVLLTDKEKVAEILMTFQALYASETTVISKTIFTSEDVTAQYPCVNGCWITFHGKDENETVFWLNGNELVNVTKGEMLIAPEEQIEMLKEVLGIPE